MPVAQPFPIPTERLLLRPYEPRDFAAMHALMSRPGMLRHPPRPPMGEEEVWTRLLRHVGHWSAFGYGFFAVEERGTGRFVGEAGFSLFRREAGREYQDAPEATWTMSPDVQGRGYATEAARAAHAWLERCQSFSRILCMIHPDNAPSLTIASKLRYREIGRAIHKGDPAIFFERRRSGLAS